MKRYLCLILFTLTITLTFGEVETYLEEIPFNEYSDLNKDNIINSNNDEIKIVQAVKIATVDPILMKDQYSMRVVDYLYDTLFNYNEKGEVVPNLVEKWEWKDDRVLELKLREDVYFQNGDKMSAKDVKESFERMLKSGVFKDFFNDIQNIKIIDINTIEIKLKGKNNLFLSMLTYYMCSITKYENGIIYGTGPYKLDKITSKEVILSKNDKYFKKNPGPFKIEILSEISDRKRALLYFNEDVDVVLDLSPKQIEELQKEGLIDKNAILKKTKELDTVAIIFGNKNKIFTDKKNRQVIESAIDKDEILKNIFKEKSVSTFFPESLFESKLSIVRKSSFSIDDLNKSSVKNKKIEITVLNDDISIKIANSLKKQLELKGILVEVVPYQQEAYLMKLENQDYEIAIYSVLFDEKYLIYNLGKVMVHDIGDQDMYNASLPFLEILKDEEEKENRDKIYDKIVFLISKNIPYIPLIHREKIAVENGKSNILLK